nr:carboxypeptidase-like regulatory domain-containing protein [Bacteroidota bacterium]
MKKSLPLVCMLLLSIPAFSGMVKGYVTNSNEDPLPFASVYVQGSTMGTATNFDGYYALELPDGFHQLVFRYVGYKKQAVTVEITGNPLNVDIQLELDNISLQEVIISADAEDPAYPIIRKTIEKRKYYLHQVGDYFCNAYTKGIFRMTEAPDKMFGDSLNTKNDSLIGVFYLSESESNLYFQQPDKMKEEMVSAKVSGDDRGFGINFISFFLMNFYNNKINLPFDRSERGFISPIANNALFYYRYRLEGTFEDDGNKIYKIRVTAKRKSDPVFNGYIYIVDEEWRIHSTDLVISKDAQVDFIDSIIIQKSLSPVTDSIWMTLTQKLQFYFSINIFGKRFAGNGLFHSQFTQYQFDNDFPERFFTNELIKVDPDANKKDSLYWAENRPIPLTGEEKVNYHKEDSLQKKRQSREYLDSLDRKHNKFRWGDLMGSYSYYRRRDSTRFIVSSPAKTIQFNTVQGLNAQIDFGMSRSLNEGKRFYIRNYVGYGFSNKRWGYKLNSSYFYNPKQFARVTLTGGIVPEQYNGKNPITPLVNSLYTLLDENNYMKIYEKAFVNIKHSCEITNGVFLNASVDFSQRNPLVNTTGYKWVNYNSREFTSNNPQNPGDDSPAFRRHNSLVFEVSARLRYRQKYISVPDKVILGSKYPDIFLSYRKGIASVWGSQTNFDLVTVAIDGRIKLGLFGESHFFGKFGTFLNNIRMEFMDFYHFDGNRTIIANSRFMAFQLLDYYALSTNRSFVEAVYEHHFNGFIFNKIPLFRKAKWRAIAGLRYLTAAFENDYFEFNAGVKNIFKVLRVDFVTAFDKGNHLRTGVVLKFNMGD